MAPETVYRRITPAPGGSWFERMQQFFFGYSDQDLERAIAEIKSHKGHKIASDRASLLKEKEKGRSESEKAMRISRAQMGPLEEQGTATTSNAEEGRSTISGVAETRASDVPDIPVIPKTIVNSHGFCERSWLKPLGILNLCPERFQHQDAAAPLESFVVHPYDFTSFEHGGNVKVKTVTPTLWTTITNPVRSTTTTKVTEWKTVSKTIKQTETTKPTVWTTKTLPVTSTTTITEIKPVTTMETFYTTVTEREYMSTVEKETAATRTILLPITTTMTVPGISTSTLLQTITKSLTHFETSYTTVTGTTTAWAATVTTDGTLSIPKPSSILKRKTNGMGNLGPEIFRDWSPFVTTIDLWPGEEFWKCADTRPNAGGNSARCAFIGGFYLFVALMLVWLAVYFIVIILSGARLCIKWLIHGWKRDNDNLTDDSSSSEGDTSSNDGDSPDDANNSPLGGEDTIPDAKSRSDIKEEVQHTDIANRCELDLTGSDVSPRTSIVAREPLNVAIHNVDIDLISHGRSQKSKAPSLAATTKSLDGYDADNLSKNDRELHTPRPRKINHIDEVTSESKELDAKTETPLLSQTREIKELSKKTSDILENSHYENNDSEFVTGPSIILAPSQHDRVQTLPNGNVNPQDHVHSNTSQVQLEDDVRKAANIGGNGVTTGVEERVSGVGSVSSPKLSNSPQPTSDAISVSDISTTPKPVKDDENQLSAEQELLHLTISEDTATQLDSTQMPTAMDSSPSSSEVRSVQLQTSLDLDKDNVSDAVVDPSVYLSGNIANVSSPKAISDSRDHSASLELNQQYESQGHTQVAPEHFTPDEGQADTNIYDEEMVFNSFDGGEQQKRVNSGRDAQDDASESLEKCLAESLPLEQDLDQTLKSSPQISAVIPAAPMDGDLGTSQTHSQFLGPLQIDSVDEGVPSVHREPVTTSSSQDPNLDSTSDELNEKSASVDLTQPDTHHQFSETEGLKTSIVKPVVSPRNFSPEVNWSPMSNKKVSRRARKNKTARG